jgi:hypothetical protein
MVKRMSEHTQFLFISHNKIAMEMAQQIGVTMQEQGVSRIVAVDGRPPTSPAPSRPPDDLCCGLGFVGLTSRGVTVP